MKRFLPQITCAVAPYNQAKCLVNMVMRGPLQVKYLNTVCGDVKAANPVVLLLPLSTCSVTETLFVNFPG